MNKVASIQIAGQVFWIDETAYEVLTAYLQKIRLQLASDESAEEIYKDIELRIAELLYELRSDHQKAITLTQLEEVIKQVGYLDSDSDETELPRKSYLDPKNKLLGGVCAGLALRLGVSVFILRIVFIALVALFGLGILLYLIFWISLDTIANRNSALVAQGKAPTAKLIASFEEPKENTLAHIQRIVFLPISIVGTLITVIFAHFRNRRKGYLFIVKNILLIALIGIALLLFAGVLEFNYGQYFNRPVSWLLSSAVLYLIVLGLFVFVREFYLAKPSGKVDKTLKRSVIIPLLVIAIGGWFLDKTQTEHQTELVEKRFVLKSPELKLSFRETDRSGTFLKPVNYQVVTGDATNNEVTLFLSYSSWGEDKDNARLNLQSIEYLYDYEENRFELDKHWALKEDTFNREQRLDVTIEIPQNMVVTSSLPLEIRSGVLFRSQSVEFTLGGPEISGTSSVAPLMIKSDNDAYYYATTRNSVNEAIQSQAYIAKQGYLHELGDEFQNKLSANEREILKDKFCQEFFISESWACAGNIRKRVTDNLRFDRAFSEDADRLERVRQYLLPDRSLFVSHLAEINSLINDLSIDYPVKSRFQEYLEHILRIKSHTSKSMNTNSS